MGYEDNIEHQLRMLDVTWRVFEEHGVTGESELILGFVYLAPNKKSANSLNASLENYDSSIRTEGILKKEWYVDGCTHPTKVSKEILSQWLEFMVALGWEHGCEFDGFGASMP